MPAQGKPARVIAEHREQSVSAVQRFMVIDDHPFFLEGLKLGLSSLVDLDCQIDSHISAQDALANAASLQNYDLILCDLNLPGIDGVAFIEQLLEQDIFVRVAIISASQYALDVRRALNAGAAGFINKGADIQEFGRAIKSILQGRRYTPEKCSLLSSLPHADQGGAEQQAQGKTNLPAQRPLLERLEEVGISARQYEVLKLVAQGLSNQAISQQLAIQECTVKSHLKVLFQVLDVNNRTSSVVAARALNLLDEER